MTYIKIISYVLYGIFVYYKLFNLGKNILNTINILIVEDSKTFNNTVTALLRRPNYKIFQAYNLNDAKKILVEHEEITYILLDLILPDGEGDDLILELTYERKVPPKVIVLSGDKDLQRRNYLFEHGVVDYFSKETPLRILIKDIHTLITTLHNNNTKSILVVDDSSFVRKSINHILHTKNYNVHLAKKILLKLLKY